MLIPLRTDRPPKRRPLVTEGLLLVNVTVYLLCVAGAYFEMFSLDDFLNATALSSRDFQFWTLVTYQFVHDPVSIWHLAFNMLFLWVFGSAVEDRLGRLGYLGFYLIGGAVAGIAHIELDPNPVIGASGSIAGVTGAFLALFPRSRIQILFFFIIIGIREIPALWFIAFFFIVDLLRATGDMLGGGGNQVAYMAHLAGYLYGFFLAFALLALRIIRREEFDVFFLFTQSRRRRAFRTASRQSLGGMYESASADTARALEKEAKRVVALTREQEELAAMRAEVIGLLNEHDREAAAAKYREMIDRFPDATLDEQRLLDIANELYRQGDHTAAARAYETLIEKYPASSHGPEVRLLLGLIYARQLGQPQRARSLIEKAKDRLRDASQLALADQLLAELPS